jgi:hypothetical protein
MHLWERIAKRATEDETSKGPPELAIGANDAQNLGRQEVV